MLGLFFCYEDHLTFSGCAPILYHVLDAHLHLHLILVSSDITFTIKYIVFNSIDSFKLRMCHCIIVILYGLRFNLVFYLHFMTHKIRRILCDIVQMSSLQECSLVTSKTVKTIYLENVVAMNLYQETLILFYKDHQSVAICWPDCEECK